MPRTGKEIKFKLLSVADNKAIDEELKALAALNKKMGKDIPDSVELTTRLKHVITAVDGDTNVGNIRKFVDTLSAYDSLKFRTYLKEITPSINRTVEYTCKHCSAVGDISLPLTVNFFWPTT